MTNQQYRNMLDRQWDDLFRQSGKSTKEIKEEGARTFAHLLHKGYDEALLIPAMVLNMGGGRVNMAYLGDWDDRTFVLFTSRKRAGQYVMNYGDFDIRTMIQNIYHKPQIKRLAINPSEKNGGIVITRELLFSLSEGRVYPKPIGFAPAKPF